ncbi:uncharacterized protein PV09_01269 [Verruconis gallopava]|uniref:Uncharacterized protein n=1 Tax=Verruconis gallopava TaxID=253628 RepID=A0A0D2ANR4_9PEZI|nr:uncharacterized protein PV09_01269 [Verruconis gallopava]KIW08353.1 hypothetical protein PV09_01269 [Verruconis gallopava]
MSAPNQGRQSPDPERQTGAQQQDPPASGQFGKQSDDNNKEILEGLKSNPEHPLEKFAEEKTSKQ